MPRTLHDDRLRRQAVAHLRKADPGMAGIIAEVGRCTFAPLAEGNHFDALVRAIVYQQLAGKAAAAIHAKFRALYGGRDPLPAEVADTPDADLRSAGLSRQKLGYIKDLADHVDTGALPLDDLDELADDDVLASLVAVKGIGRWSAQMFLMFRLGRADVFPELDLGVQKAVQRLEGLADLPKPREVARIGERWRPYRTIAAWYLWRSNGLNS